MQRRSRCQFPLSSVQRIGIGTQNSAPAQRRPSPMRYAGKDDVELTRQRLRTKRLRPGRQYTATTVFSMSWQTVPSSSAVSNRDPLPSETWMISGLVRCSSDDFHRRLSERQQRRRVCASSETPKYACLHAPSSSSGSTPCSNLVHLRRQPTRHGRRPTQATETTSDHDDAGAIVLPSTTVTMYCHRIQRAMACSRRVPLGAFSVFTRGLGH